MRFKCFVYILDNQERFKDQLMYNVDEKHEDEGTASKGTESEKIEEALNDAATRLRLYGKCVRETTG